MCTLIHARVKFNTYLCFKSGLKFSHFEICFFQFLQHTECMSTCTLSIAAILLLCLSSHFNSNIQGDNNMWRYNIITKNIYIRKHLLSVNSQVNIHKNIISLFSVKYCNTNFFPHFHQYTNISSFLKQYMMYSKPTFIHTGNFCKVRETLLQANISRFESVLECLWYLIFKII